MSINISTTLGTNTGRSAGDVRMGRIKHLILTRGKVFTAAELADSDSLKTAIEAGIKADRTSPNKIFIFTGFREAEDATGDPQVGTLGDGYEEVLNEAIPKFNLKHTAGVAQTQSFTTFNGWTDPFFFVDDKGIFWYRDAANGGAQGFTLANLYASYPRPGGTGAIVTGLVKLTVAAADEFKSAVGAIKLGFQVPELTNMVDVALYEAAAAAGYVFKIGAKMKYSGVNVYAAQKAGLLQSAAWKATRLDTGANVIISGIAADDTINNNQGGWAVTLDNASALPVGTKVKLELKDPASLAALATPVLGIESISVTVTKP